MYDVGPAPKLVLSCDVAAARSTLARVSRPVMLVRSADGAGATVRKVPMACSRNVCACVVEWVH